MSSIKTKGAIFVFIILLAFIFIMFPLSHGITTQWMRSELNENLKNSATTIRKFTDEHLLQYIGPLERLGENPDIQSMDWDKQRDVLMQQVTIDYKELAIVNPEGMAYYTDGNQVYLGDRSYIQKALSGEFNISEALISRVTGEKIRMIGYPIFRDEEVVGALIARIEPNLLAEFLEEEAGGLYSIYFVLDREGYPKIHPNQEYLTEELTFLELEATEDNHAELRGFLQKSFLQEKGYGSYSTGDQEVIIGFSHLQSVDWILYIGQYEEELIAGMQLLNSIYLISGIILIFLLAGVSIFIAKTFSDPILELEAQFQKAAKGDLNVRSKILRNDEIGRASENFNRMMDKMKTLTYFDPVTKLPNKSVFEEQFQREHHRKESHEKKGSKLSIDPEMSIILLTLKSFSKINERFGYSEGDNILRELTRRVKTILPDNTKIFRGKGDQFILWIAQRKDQEDLLILSERLISKIEWPIETEQGVARIKTHIGISQYPKDGVEGDTLIKKATFAGNYSKKNHEEKIRIFDEALYEREIEDGNLLQEIDRGLADEEFELYYQPIYQLDDMIMKGVEALIRWNHPKEGFVSPGRFIPLAESSGSIRKIDYYVVKKALKQIKDWEGTPCENLMISVNLSADTFEDPFFESWLVNLMEEGNYAPGKLQLELTERIILEDIKGVITKFKSLRKAGCNLAIDDFGVGYSSLSYLAQLPIDQLKIDQSFIQNLHKDKGTKAVVSTVIKMGEELDMFIIAEGIEKEEELQYLNKIGCPLGQGFLLAHPMKKTLLEQLVKNSKK